MRILRVLEPFRCGFSMPIWRGSWTSWDTGRFSSVCIWLNTVSGPSVHIALKFQGVDHQPDRKSAWRVFICQPPALRAPANLPVCRNCQLSLVCGTARRDCRRESGATRRLQECWCVLGARWVARSSAQDTRPRQGQPPRSAPAAAFAPAGSSVGGTLRRSGYDRDRDRRHRRRRRGGAHGVGASRRGVGACGRAAAGGGVRAGHRPPPRALARCRGGRVARAGGGARVGRVGGGARRGRPRRRGGGRYGARHWPAGRPVARGFARLGPGEGVGRGGRGRGDSPRGRWNLPPSRLLGDRWAPRSGARVTPATGTLPTDGEKRECAAHIRLLWVLPAATMGESGANLSPPKSAQPLGLLLGARCSRRGKACV